MGRVAATPAGDLQSRVGSSLELVRVGLVERLLASDAVPVVCVVAPAGYGKRDNDPAVLLTYIAVALDRVEPIDPRVVSGLPYRGPRPWVRYRGWRRRWRP